MKSMWYSPAASLNTVEYWKLTGFIFYAVVSFVPVSVLFDLNAIKCIPPVRASKKYSPLQKAGHNRHFLSSIWEPMFATLGSTGCAVDGLNEYLNSCSITSAMVQNAATAPISWLLILVLGNFSPACCVRKPKRWWAPRYHPCTPLSAPPQ